MNQNNKEDSDKISKDASSQSLNFDEILSQKMEGRNGKDNFDKFDLKENESQEDPSRHVHFLDIEENKDDDKKSEKEEIYPLIKKEIEPKIQSENNLIEDKFDESDEIYEEFQEESIVSLKNYKILKYRMRKLFHTLLQ